MKRITITLFWIMLFFMFATISVSATEQETFADVKSADYYAEAATALKQAEIFGGYTDGTFGAQKSVTRAEMAAVVCRIIDKEIYAEKEKNKTDFKDVSAQHWASGYINIASKEGIIDGYGDKSFRPENPVKHEEAIKMIVCALGYAQNVEMNLGDWSAGYLEIADNKGISDNLKGAKGYNSTRGDIAVMAYNGLLSQGHNFALIEITSAEQIYALSRILAPKAVKTNFLNSNASYSKENDFYILNVPGEFSEESEKIKYLQTASYRLTKDIELIVQRNKGEDFFLGIGSKEFPFKGAFYGEGNTITLVCNKKLFLNNYCNTGTGLFGYTNKAKIVNVNVEIKSDIVIESSVKAVYIGGIVGESVNTKFLNCSVNFLNSVFGVDYAVGEKYTGQPFVGGITGYSRRSIYDNCSINMSNSSIIAKGGIFESNSMYAMFSVGGVIGFSGPGSNNTDNIGRLGNRLYNCKVTSNNDTQRDIIIASVECGQEVCAGGLVGCTFNNFIAKDCLLEVTRGNILAVKTGSTDKTSTFGTQAGGILGRMEHTGELYNCNVIGDYLNVISSSPNNQSSSGGIVGVDLGPYHRDIVTINDCSFDGSDTSNIEVAITSTDKINANKIVTAGGIVGWGTYKIRDCFIAGTKITNRSKGIAQGSYAGDIAGFYADKGSYLWATKKFFLPQDPGIVGCGEVGITFDVSDNVTISDYSIK